jgi:hypothetical protein
MVCWVLFNGVHEIANAYFWHEQYNILFHLSRLIYTMPVILEATTMHLTEGIHWSCLLKMLCSLV